MSCERAVLHLERAGQECAPRSMIDSRRVLQALRKCKSERSTLKAELKEAAHAGANYQGQLEGLQESLAKSQSECTHQQSDLLKKITELNSEISRLSSDNKAAEMKLAEVKGAAGSELEATQAALKRSEEAGSAARSAQAAAEKNADELTEQVADLKAAATRQAAAQQDTEAATADVRPCFCPLFLHHTTATCRLEWAGAYRRTSACGRRTSG